MQNSKTITLNQRLSCTAFELSVGQILELFWLMNKFAYPSELEAFAAAHKADLLKKSAAVLQFSPPTDFLKLGSEQTKAVIDLFFEVNQAFFKPESDDYAGNNAFSMDYSGAELYKIYSNHAASLARLGHPNILDYPFSFFLAAVDNLAE